MRAAVLSAGLSLRQTYDPGADYDVRIGVNSAAAAFPCDWWACGDVSTFDRVEPIGLPVLFTISDAMEQYRKRANSRDRIDDFRLVTWSSVACGLGAPACWTNWSITAAIGLAAHLGAKAVDVFGHDMRGTVDVTGHELATREEKFGTKRSPNVPTDWATIRAWATARGIKITEHQPEPMPCT